MIAVILSAQCTDARVNIVTAELFKKYDSLEKFAGADLKELEQDIHSTGFYHTKARNIIACCKELVEKHHGEVPGELSELTALAGVGRKTANVIRGNIYNEPSIVVDTHVKRISRKLGLTENEEPEKIEYDLMDVLPKDHWILWNIHIITLGRTICTARSPKCGECFLRELCPAAENATGGAGKSEAGNRPGETGKARGVTGTGKAEGGKAEAVNRSGGAGKAAAAAGKGGDPA